jgi:hypothetical protein
MALGIVLGALDLAANAFTNLKVDLDEEKAAQLAAQIKVDVLTQTVRDLKISADRFASQIPTLEGKGKHLENKVVDWLKRSGPRNSAWSASLGQMTIIRSRSLNWPRNWKVSPSAVFRAFYHS